MRVLWALAAIAVGISAPAAAGDQFDLVCTGTVKWKPRGAGEAVVARYRVDIAQKTWCRDECKTVQVLQSVEPGRLVFQSHEPTFAADDYLSHWVDRQSGAWSDTLIGAGAFSTYWAYSGVCEPAAFSGFPVKPKF